MPAVIARALALRPRELFSEVYTMMRESGGPVSNREIAAQITPIHGTGHGRRSPLRVCSARCAKCRNITKYNSLADSLRSLMWYRVWRKLRQGADLAKLRGRPSPRVPIVVERGIGQDRSFPQFITLTVTFLCCRIATHNFVNVLCVCLSRCGRNRRGIRNVFAKGPREAHGCPTSMPR